MAAAVKVERTAQFWQFTTPRGDHLPGAFPTAEVLGAIGKLRLKKIYVDLPDETRLLAVVKKVKNDVPRHLILYRVRHKNLPAVELAGSIGDLPITSDQNVAEETHILFFPRNVIGVLFNQDGPRVSRLPDYLRNQFNLEVGVKPLLDPDTARNLNDMGLLTSVELNIPVANAALLQVEQSDATDTVDAMKLMARESKGTTLHLKSVFSVKNDDGPRVWRSVIDQIVPFAALDLFKKLKVHAKSINPDQPSITIDFAEEQLVLRVSVALENEATRRANALSVRRAVVDAHTRLQTQINASAPPVAEVMSMEELVSVETPAVTDEN